MYTYQPCQNAKPLAATSINISTAINDSLRYVNYKLTLLSDSDVFAKYRVEDFTVKPDALRYYDISSIFRKWDKETDEDLPTHINNTITEVSFAVGKLYSACTVNGAVSYSCLTTETILIADKYVGMVRYSNGWSYLLFDRCDSHYVAFSTDKQIDTLLEADVYYVSQNCKFTAVDWNNDWIYGNPVENYVYLKYDDIASNDADKLFGKKYIWKRIQSVEDFMNDPDTSLTDEAKERIQEKQWVLRFAETDYEFVTGAGITYMNQTYVSEVTILRLKFETEGKVYNLGVVDNKQTGSNSPDNTNTDELDPTGWFTRKLKEILDSLFGWINDLPWWVWLVVVLMVIAILLPVLSIIFPAVGRVVASVCKGIVTAIVWLCKGVWWIICLPFKGIIAIVRKIKDRKDGGG